MNVCYIQPTPRLPFPLLSPVKITGSEIIGQGSERKHKYSSELPNNLSDDFRWIMAWISHQRLS